MLAVQSPQRRHWGVKNSFQYCRWADETLSRVVEPPVAGAGIAELAAWQLLKSVGGLYVDISPIAKC